MITVEKAAEVAVVVAEVGVEGEREEVEEEEEGGGE